MPWVTGLTVHSAPHVYGLVKGPRQMEVPIGTEGCGSGLFLPCGDGVDGIDASDLGGEFDSVLVNDGEGEVHTGLRNSLVHQAARIPCLGNVQIFFTDFFGINEVYNVPGTSGDPNWTLRLNDDFAKLYSDKLKSDEALNLPLVMIYAMKARGWDFYKNHQELLEKLESLVNEK